MDRRGALKRLAAGGATVIGATAISSQPAFAYTNPIVSGSPTVTVTTTGSLTALVGISGLPSAVCPASAVSTPSPTQISLTWQTFYPAGGVVMSTGSGTAVSIPGGFGQWYPNDRIRVTMVYRYRCVYGGSTVQLCVRWFREFRASAFGTAANWVLQAGASTGPTTVGCPASLTALSRTSSTEYAPGGRISGGPPFD